MKCNNRNKLVTIGDMFDFAVFKGNVFAWSKQKHVTNFQEFYKLCGSGPIHFEKVMQIAGSNLQLDKEPLLATVYSGIQVSSKYMKEHYHEFIIKKRL